MNTLFSVVFGVRCLGDTPHFPSMTLRSVRLRPMVRYPVSIAAAVLVNIIASPAGAIEIKITDPTPHLTDTIAKCDGRNADKYKDCKSTVYVKDKSAKSDDAEFKKSFDEWNKGNAANAKWSRKEGGALPGGKLEIVALDANANSFNGGFSDSNQGGGYNGFRIDWTYAGADKTDFFWSQGLYDNYANGKLVPKFYEMDVKPAGCDNTNLLAKCPPLYPFQYADRHFFDGPRGPWPTASFDAVAMLSKVDFTKRELTVYEGVYWGFQLSATLVPEPETWAMMLLGLGSVMWRVRFA